MHQVPKYAHPSNPLPLSILTRIKLQKLWFEISHSNFKSQIFDQKFMSDKAQKDHKLHMDSTLIGGLLTGACAKFISHPIDTVKAKLQISRSIINTQHIIDNNIFQYTRRIIRNEGIRGLYPGVGISTIMGAPASMLFWGTFEKSKYYLGHYSVRTLYLKFSGEYNASIFLFSSYGRNRFV